MRGFFYMLGAIIFLILTISGASVTINHPTLTNLGVELVFVAMFAACVWLMVRVNKAPREENER